MLYDDINKSHSKLSVRSIASIQAALSYENQEYSDIIIRHVTKGIIDKQCQDFKGFFITLKNLFKIQDSIADWRV